MTGGIGNDFEIARSLVLSTAHMRPATARDWMPRCPWSCFEKGDFGWFMHVCDDVGITEAHAVPLEIRSAIHVAKREASVGRNPRTGDEIQIPASKQPKFKAGKGLKDAIN